MDLYNEINILCSIRLLVVLVLSMCCRGHCLAESISELDKTVDVQPQLQLEAYD